MDLGNFESLGYILPELIMDPKNEFDEHARAPQDAMAL